VFSYWDNDQYVERVKMSFFKKDKPKVQVGPNIKLPDLKIPVAGAIIGGVGSLIVAVKLPAVATVAGAAALVSSGAVAGAVGAAFIDAARKQSKLKK